MLPLPLAGIALTGRLLLTKYNGNNTAQRYKKNYRLRPAVRRKIRFRPPTGNRQPMFNAPNPADSLQRLVKGLSASLSQFTRKIAGEDYRNIIKDFLPEGAEVLTPQYPIGSKAVQLADIDGDSRNELIASYHHNGTVKTFVLKKQDDLWYKSAEFDCEGHDTVNYRNTADITGEGKKQLVIGMTSKGKAPVLYGYAMENGNMSRLFSRDYHMFEVINGEAGRKYTSKAKFAIWNKDEDGNYVIDVLHWNGKSLDRIENTLPYYRRSVIPYHVRKIKQSPYSPSNWFYLADALVKAGAVRDASIAVKTGMSMDRDLKFKEKFNELNRKISETANRP